MSTVITSSHLIADLAADRTRTLLAEAAAHRLARPAAAADRTAPTRRWSWSRMRARPAPAPGRA